VSDKLTDKQQRLKKKHGTPREFSKGVYAALGEVSLFEAQRAIAKYEQEWRDAGEPMKKHKGPPYLWIKITLHLPLNLENYKQFVCDLAIRFESVFRVKHMYYARYTDLDSSTVEISAHTDADWGLIKKFMMQTRLVDKVEIVDRTTGSVAHAHGYQVVKRLKPYAEDLAQDDAFLDVLHWQCNMRGLDYVREARLYLYAALRIIHKTALESSQNIASMRRFNSDVTARATVSSLVARLNLLGRKAGKGRKSVKTVSDDPGPPPKRSGRAASRKGRGSKHSKSSGSDRR